VLPGAESIVSTGPGAFRGVLASRIQFITVRADVTATFHDAQPPRHLRLELEGRPRGLVGSFSVSIRFDMSAIDGRAQGATPIPPVSEAPVPPVGEVPWTEVRYAIDLRVTGRLAAFGVPLLRDTLRRQIAELVENVAREIASRTGRGA
jgi:carbon monoxide dehydrogenase subunit G